MTTSGRPSAPAARSWLPWALAFISTIGALVAVAAAIDPLFFG